jgi:hypothetical protein
MRKAALVTTLLLIAGCSSPLSQQCGLSLQALYTDTLYFGREKPGGTVTAQEWQQFLDQTVTPRFPQGLSVWEASGQWKSATNALVRESSYVLSIVHGDQAGTENADNAIQEIVTTYKTQFQQEAVLRVRSSACVSF